jgi:cytochrome P450
MGKGSPERAPAKRTGVDRGRRGRDPRRMAIAAWELPPGPQATPVRQAVAWVRRPLGLLEDCRRQFGDIFTLRLAGMPPLVMLSDPANIREVLTGDPRTLRSGEANAVLQATLGRRSLLLLDGDEHLRERRLLLPAFHGERMRRYGEVIAGVAEREVARWPVDRPLALAPAMRRIALEVIGRAVIGIDEPARLAALTRALRRLLDATTRPARLLLLMALQPGGPVMRTWQRTSPTLLRVDELLYDEIARRRADGSGAGREDILSLLLQARDEDGAPMGDRHLRDELMTLLVAGHETTATALAWAFERLVRHPGAYDRVRAEAASPDGDAYLDAVVKETLRIRPVIPFVVRQVAEPVELAGRRWPPGVRLAPCVHLVHRRPDVYPEPDAFRPERFLETPPGTYTWIPFGGGTRRCLGAAFALYEARVVLRVVGSSGRLMADRPQDEAIGRRGLALVPAREARVRWRPEMNA